MHDYYAVLLMRLNNTKFNYTRTLHAQQDKPTDYMLGYHSTATLLKMVLNIHFQFCTFSFVQSEVLALLQMFFNSSRIGMSTKNTSLYRKYAFSKSFPE